MYECTPQIEKRVQSLLAAAGDCPHHDLAALRDYFALYSQAREAKAAVMRHVFGPRLAEVALKPGRLLRLALPRYAMSAAPALLLHSCLPPNADRLGARRHYHCEFHHLLLMHHLYIHPQAPPPRHRKCTRPLCCVPSAGSCPLPWPPNRATSCMARRPQDCASC